MLVGNEEIGDLLSMKLKKLPDFQSHKDFAFRLSRHLLAFRWSDPPSCEATSPPPRVAGRYLIITRREIRRISRIPRDFSPKSAPFCQ